MATLILTDDEVALEDIVGTTTLLRGRRYANGGAVVKLQWDPKSARVFGQVQGSGRLPYTATATLATNPAGALQSFTGSCTCPVRTDCKHCVALLIAALREVPLELAPPLPPKVAPWEKSLAAVVDHRDNQVVTSPVALQFELIQPPAQHGPRRPSIAPRLGLRPVAAGRNGNWIRTGISWSNVAYARPGLLRDHARLLAEIIALHSAGRPNHYGYLENTIYLDTIASRRIWDVLLEAQSSGLPLVHAGRVPRPVTVATEPAHMAIDLARAGRSLILQPHITVGAEQPLFSASVLLGDPAHGIMWWQTAGEDEPALTNRVLRLARLGMPIDPDLRALLERGPVSIPERDESRFLRDYVPRLRRRVHLVSVDESVVLPDPCPPVLSLTVRHGQDQRVDLQWAWLYTVGETRERVALWSDRPWSDRPLSDGPLSDSASQALREPAVERAVLASVTAVVKRLPELLDEHAETPRLVEALSLPGVAGMRFCTDVLPRLTELDQVDIEVIGEPPPYRQALDAPVISLDGSSGQDDRDWFNLAVTVTVEDEQVPFNRLFLAIAQGEDFLILPSGTYFSLDRPEFSQLAALIAEARTLQDHENDHIRLNRFQASLWADLERIAVVTGQATAWQRSVRALAGATDLVEQPPPEGLTATLRPYQHTGFNWLAFLYEHGLGGVLADEMGLGKTLQTVALICHAREQALTSAPFLVVAPTSVVFNWVAECRRFAPSLKVAMVTETQRRRGVELAEIAADADVVITSYTLFRLEYQDYADIEWAGLVMDEAQFVKNHQSQNHGYLKKLPAPFKLAITGTPMENNLLELWAILSITAPGLFANQKRFEDFYRTPIEKDRDSERLGQLRRRVSPLLLRRTKEQVASDLPAKQEQVIELELNPRHRKIYQTHLQRERQKVLGLLGDLAKNRFEIFRSLTLLRQASLDVALIDPKYAKVPSTKLDALMEQLADVASEGHRTLVFSQFTRFLDAARRRLESAGIEYCYLDGKTRNRPAVLAEFKEGTAPVFLISLKAGGFGLNLTEADYCILLDPWWNPATEAQAVDRTHRIGQTKNVMVYRLVAKDTIEEKVMALKATKAALFNSVMDDGAFSSGAMTAADIRGLLE